MDRPVKKVNFVFPNVPHILSGGLKMVFEYANRLTQRGYEVGIVFNCDWGFYHARMYIPYFIKRYFLYPTLIKYHPRWFKLNPKVKKSFVTTIVDKEMPDADAIIATAVMTAPPIAKLSPSKGKKIYFIQGFENWSKEWPDSRVMSTYRLGLKNIVVAKWLEEKVEEAGADCTVIPNGLDFTTFNIDTPIRERTGHKISMLYHEAPEKGAKYGLKAIKQLKRIYPDLEAHLFGVPPRPGDLPKWIHYTQYATETQLREIYNQSTIYMCSSVAEAFGLTGAEAMACGAAYVSSDYGGVHEYATDGRNVLLSPPKDIDGLVSHVSYLFEHPEERIRLAENGYNDIQAFSWEKALDKFEKVLQS
jgi:glycosyltransferase involved in cell wall biosynthesis